MTFQYEVKAPNVIHLLMRGVRREIRLEKLAVEMFSDHEPMAVEFKLSTDHKDIYLPPYPVVIYIPKTTGFGRRGIWEIMDMVVKEIVSILQIGQSRMEAMTLAYDEHRANYAMQPSGDIIRLPGEMGVFTKARVRCVFKPTALRIDNYVLSVQAQRRTYPEEFVFEAVIKDKPQTHPFLLNYSGTLVAVGCKTSP